MIFDGLGPDLLELTHPTHRHRLVGDKLVCEKRTRWSRLRHYMSASDIEVIDFSGGHVYYMTYKDHVAACKLPPVEPTPEEIERMHQAVLVQQILARPL